MKTEKLGKPELCIFLILFLTSSFTITNDIISSTVTIGLWIMTLAYLLLSFQKMNSDLLVIFVVLIGAFALSAVVNGENFKNMMSIIFSFFVAFFFANIYDFETFQRSFVRVMKILCIISLVGFFAYALIPSLKNIAVVANNGGVNYSNLFIYANSVSGTRNLGMFWEPGAYQTFINIAFLFEIVREKPDLKTILLFIVTTITTFSTTGYIGLALILFLVFLHKNNMKNENLKSFIAFVFVVLAFLVYFYQDTLLATSRSTVFGKLVTFFTKKQFNATAGTSSATVRFFAITKPFEAFMDRPLFGWGYQGLIDRLKQYTRSMNTCTIINWFAVYGVTFGTAMLAGLLRFSKKIGKNMLAIVLVFVIIFVVTMSENYVNNAFFFLLVMYGYTKEPFQGLKYDHHSNKRI